MKATKPSWARHLYLLPIGVVGLIATMLWTIRGLSSFLGLLSLFVFLIFQQLFVRANREILKRNKNLLGHCERLSEEELKEHANDLRMTHDGSLQELCAHYASGNQSLCVFLTGATGYVGRAVLFELLSSVSTKMLSDEKIDHKIWVAIRAKKSKTAQERLDNLRRDPIFKDLIDCFDQVIKVVETGDMATPDCGISSESLAQLKREGVDAIVHSAADVRFDMPLEVLGANNITTTLQIQEFSRQWKSHLIYVSTVFINPGPGSESEPLPEELFPLGKFDAQELYKSMLDDQRLAEKAKLELGFPNNYTFSKCVAEHLVSSDNRGRTSIIRPAAVGPAWTVPYPGWNGDQLSTITAFTMLPRTRLIKVHGVLEQTPLAIIPVDVVAVEIVREVLCSPKHQCTSKFTIRNSVLDFYVMPDSINSFWSLSGRLRRTENVIMQYLQRLNHMFPFMAYWWHLLSNVTPLYLVTLHNRSIAWLENSNKKHPDLMKVLKLLKLYEPFFQKYHFSCSHRRPSLFTSKKYNTRCFLPAVENKIHHRFRVIPLELESSPEDCLRFVNLIPSNRWDFWWAFSQPYGNFAIRLIAFFASKVLRLVFREIMVDLHSVSSFVRELEANPSAPVCIAPTHRSFCDFVLMSYLFFSLPELGVRCPHISAITDLQKLWFSFILGWAQAFPVHKNRKDSTLATRIRAIWDKFQPIVVFLEGTPSGDCRLCPLNKEFLTALQSASRDLESPILLPAVIDYERIPEQAAFDCDTSIGFFRWLWDLACGVFGATCGDVRITFAPPLRMHNNDSTSQLAIAVQERQRKCSLVTEFHLAMGEQNLQIPMEQLRSAILEAGGTVSPRSSSLIGQHILPSEHWGLQMQWMHHFAHSLNTSHPKWARWILDEAQLASTGREEPEGGFKTVVLDRLKSKLDWVDDSVKTTMLELRNKGITSPTPSHVANETVLRQPAEGLGAFWFPAFAASASFSNDCASEKELKNESQLAKSPVVPNSVKREQEESSHGSWGSADSSFRLSYNK